MSWPSRVVELNTFTNEETEAQGGFLAAPKVTQLAGKGGGWGLGPGPPDPETSSFLCSAGLSPRGRMVALPGTPPWARGPGTRAGGQGLSGRGHVHGPISTFCIILNLLA